jgi:hypothetical protein
VERLDRLLLLVELSGAVNKRRVGLVVALALLGALLLLVVGLPRSAVRPATTATDDRGGDSAPVGPRLAPPASGAPATAAPVIEAVTVEKTEVCSGEDNLVTVTLASGYASNDTIRIMMPEQGSAGPQMPFRLSLSRDKQQPEMPEVVVFGRDGALATVKIPPVKVKDCDPGPVVRIDVALTANTSATFAFTATVLNPGSTPFKPVEWRWDFGDGSDAVTKVRTAEHGYEDRQQNTRMSTFLVHVRAVDAQGVELLGRHGMELRNQAFEALRIKNAVLLATELNPRFPVMGADGRVTQRVRIHHAYDKPVNIDRVFVQRFRGNEQGREDMQESAVDPRQILGTNVVPPGRGIEITATLDTRAEPGTRLLTFDLVGTSVDGMRASGQFSVLRPPELIPQAERDIVTDARLRAEILAVRKMLGRDEVTLDEITQLRREGALDNLTGDDGQPLQVAAASGTDDMPPRAEQPKSRKGTPLRRPSTATNRTSQD